MTKKEFIQLHLNLSIQLPKSVSLNVLPSETDPTQDVPVRMIEMSAYGVPLNVKELKGVFSNLKAENLTTIEKRNNDVFDQYGELQESIGKMHNKVTTNYVKPSKKQKNEK